MLHPILLRTVTVLSVEFTVALSVTSGALHHCPGRYFTTRILMLDDAHWEYTHAQHKTI